MIVFTLLSTYLSRAADPNDAHEPSGAHQSRGIVIPWFTLGFIGVAAFNSLSVLPKAMVGAAVSFDTVILAMAALFAWLMLGGGAIDAGVSALLS